MTPYVRTLAFLSFCLFGENSSDEIVLDIWFLALAWRSHTLTRSVLCLDVICVVCSVQVGDNHSPHTFLVSAGRALLAHRRRHLAGLVRLYTAQPSVPAGDK